MSKHKYFEEQISSDIIYTGKIINCCLDSVKLPNEKIAQREVVLHSGGVVIIPITKDNKFVMVEQYRYCINQALLEFPAGRLDKKNESPELAAIRELSEETGYKAKVIEELSYIFTAPGFSSEKLYVFLATDLEKGEKHPDEDEFVDIVYLTVDELKEKIRKFEITDAKTLAAYSLFLSRIIQ